MDEKVRRHSAKEGRRKVLSYVEEGRKDLEAIERLAELGDLTTVKNPQARETVEDAYAGCVNIVANFRLMAQVLASLLIYETVKNRERN